jgi:selenocysteine-specific elongation factor
MRVRMHTGTAESVGEVVLLDQERLDPGMRGLVQLRLDHPLVCGAGDRFLLRLASPMITLGGGLVLEESEHRLKRFKGYVLDKLSARREHVESPRELLEEHLRHHHEAWQGLEELAVHIKREPREVRVLLEELAAEKHVHLLGNNRWIHVDRLEQALSRMRAALEGWFDAHPLRGRMDLRDLRAATPFEPTLLSALVTVAGERGWLVAEAGGSLRLAGRAPALDEETRRASEACLASLKGAGFKPPTSLELAGEFGLSPERVSSLLELLADQGEIVRVGGELYLARGPLEEARAAVIANCGEHGHLEIPALRDRLGTTRKFLIPLLEHFDSEGLTIRQGGHRILRRR